MTASASSSQHRQWAVAALIATTASLWLTGCATTGTASSPATGSTTAPVSHERGVLLQRVDTVIQQAQPGSGLRLGTSPDPLVVGGTLNVQVTSPQAGYLYLYQIATDGKTLSLVFPNAIDGANYLTPGQHSLPRASWQLKAHGPAGVGYLLAVQTPQPLNLIELQADVNQGTFNLKQAYSAALTTLHEVAPR